MSNISLILEGLYEIKRERDHFVICKDGEEISTADTRKEAEEDIKEYEKEDKDDNKCTKVENPYNSSSIVYHKKYTDKQIQAAKFSKAWIPNPKESQGGHIDWKKFRS